MKGGMTQEREHRADWKGERKTINGRFPMAVHKRISEDAAAHGVPRGDWLMHLVAIAYDRSDYDPIPDVEHRDPMLMTG